MSGFFTDKDQEAIIKAEHDLFANIIPIAGNEIRAIEANNRLLRAQGLNEPPDAAERLLQCREMIKAAERRLLAFNKKKDEIEREQLWEELWTASKALESLAKRMQATLEKGPGDKRMDWKDEMRVVMGPWGEELQGFLNQTKYLEVTFKVNFKEEQT
ncbi:hypothetical protein ACJ41O_010293 [Fusarium nematophilum]